MLVQLAEQDRGRWDTAPMTEGLDILQHALVRDRMDEYEYQVQALATLHARRAIAQGHDWLPIVSWLEEHVRLACSRVAKLPLPSCKRRSLGPA